MNYFVRILFLIFPCLMEVAPAQNDPMPAAERVKAAADRVQPELTIALEQKGLHFGDPVFIRAFKEERQLELWVRNRDTGKYTLFRTWPIAALSGELGPKIAEGDGQVPEGFYSVPASAMKADSMFHLAFNIGFPNAYDTAHGRTGSFIMIHGNRVSIGCLAMTDAKIEEIYTLCDAAHRAGQQFFRVHIYPFRMTDERTTRESANSNSAFWQNLREVYDDFEKNRIPPDVIVVNGRYQIRKQP